MNLYEQINSKIIGRIAIRPAEAELLSKYAGKEGDYLDIGCLWGGTAILAALSKIENDVDGHVYTIDSMRGGYWAHGDPEVENEALSYTKVILNLRNFSVESRVDVLVADSNPLPLPKDVKPTVVLIDGDHRYEGCMTDWLNVKKLEPDYVLFHDYNTKHPGVTRVIDQVKEHDNEYKQIEIVDTMVVFERVQ